MHNSGSGMEGRVSGRGDTDVQADYRDGGGEQCGHAAVDRSSAVVQRVHVRRALHQNVAR